MRLNRQLVGAINVYVRARGLKPDPAAFAELTKKIGQRPNVVIDLGPKSPVVQKILRKYQRLLGDSATI